MACDWGAGITPVCAHQRQAGESHKEWYLIAALGSEKKADRGTTLPLHHRHIDTRRNLRQPIVRNEQGTPIRLEDIASKGKVQQSFLCHDTELHPATPTTECDSGDLTVSQHVKRAGPQG